MNQGILGKYQTPRKNEATSCGQCKQNITMDNFKLYPRRHSEVPDIRIPEGNWKRGWKPSIQRIGSSDTGIGTRNSIKENSRR